MERTSGVREQLAASKEVRSVVDVSAVGGASPGGDDAGVAQLGEVVRNEALRLAKQLRELTDASVAPGQLGEQLPSMGVSDQREDRRSGRVGHGHATDSTSICIDGFVRVAVARATNLLSRRWCMSTFTLIPGAGGVAWYWHRVVARLSACGHEAIAVDLPGD